MASKLVLSLSLPSNPIKTGDKRGNLRRIANQLIKAASGQSIPAVSMDARHSAVAASGTVTCASVAAADTVTVNGLVFTAVNGGTPTAVQFDMSGSDTADAASLVAAINASTDAAIQGVVTASNVAGVVTITAVVPGKTGNAITLSSSNGTRAAVSGARLSGGSETRVSF